ncbi:MAG: hypothetical protein ACRD1E_08490 [Terriglobales bacterium]
MSVKTWLVLFILSMTFSAEVLAWAIHAGQFTGVNRARAFPLRDRPRALAPPRHRPWVLAAIVAAMALMLLVWAHGMAVLVQESLR